MECLETLSSTNCFAVLQEKLNTWKYEFQLNKPEANIGRCCELLELNARVQSQLFKLLGLCALYAGGIKGSEMKLKRHLELQLGEDYFKNGLTTDVVLNILADVNRKNGKSIKSHNVPNNSNISERLNELEDAIVELSKEADPKSSQTAKSNRTATSIPTKIRKKKSASIKRQPLSIGSNGIRAGSLPNFNETNTIPENEADSVYSEEPPQQQLVSINNSNTSPSNRGDFHEGGSEVDEIRNDKYLQSLVGRYNDLFSESRINAMNILNEHLDDHENNQRILFALVMTTARHTSDLQRTLSKAYKSSENHHNSSSSNNQFRQSISRTYMKNLKAEIVYEMLNKTTRNGRKGGKNRYHRYKLPLNNGVKFSFVELEGFLERLIELFWNFGGTQNGLNVLEAADGELFDEHKYRRSYDSDYIGPFVNHHIWPCLLQGYRVLVKGEACTWASSKMSSSRSIVSSNASTAGR